MVSDTEKKILKELVHRGHVEKEIMVRAMTDASSEQRSIVSVFQEKRLVDESALARVIADIAHYDVIDFASTKPDPRALKKVSPKFAQHYCVVPLSLTDCGIVICVANPFDPQLHEDLQALMLGQITYAVATLSDIRDAIKAYYGVGAETIQAMGSEGRKDDQVWRLEETVDLESDDSRMAKFVNQLLLEARTLGATDIHIEPFEHDLHVRYRIDGVLVDIPTPPDAKRLHQSIVTRIKIIANLDIAEHRLPQDGRLKVSSQGEEMDLRISILPTPFGESITIRLLSSNVSLGLEQLGFDEHTLMVITRLINKPHGIILLTGPTGSGKTTTLYACLHKVNDGKRKIITIEDPIEYQMPGVTQIQVNPKVGLTFSHGLRSMLRHDPDIMMVGEIRDMETATIAMRVALTGHLVFSTLHTNDSVSAVTRLIEMGVESYLVSSGIECIVAQRLVRRICPRCRVEDSDAVELLKDTPLWKEQGAFKAFKGAGCPHCRQTGYKGRLAIHEVFAIDADVRSLIARRASVEDIRSYAIAHGMKLLRDDGFGKVKQGLTSVDEIMRMTGDAC